MYLLSSFVKNRESKLLSSRYDKNKFSVKTLSFFLIHLVASLGLQLYNNHLDLNVGKVRLMIFIDGEERG